IIGVVARVHLVERVVILVNLHPVSTVVLGGDVGEEIVTTTDENSVGFVPIRLNILERAATGARTDIDPVFAVVVHLGVGNRVGALVAIEQVPVASAFHHCKFVIGCFDTANPAGAGQINSIIETGDGAVKQSDVGGRRAAIGDTATASVAGQ